ncbi:peptidoglycan DD-metalloendopeptidase family protein [Nocardia farcinica]|nr:peptidoglycan DD-metalloendopeptidase family protein [Nocardia farcinica]MBC9818825.1 peptidoglycan DD-metalloendopeptidase family protein [Nocardia farcinica]
MNHRSTLAPGHRPRTGHRYRDDDQPFAPATESYAEPSYAESSYAESSYAESGYRFAAPAAAATAAGFGAQVEPEPHAAWHDGSAWTARDEQAAWNQGEQPAWSQDDRAAWHQQEWDQQSAWTEQDSWSRQDSWNQQASWSDGGAWGGEQTRSAADATIADATAATESDPSQWQGACDNNAWAQQPAQWTPGSEEPWTGNDWSGEPADEWTGDRDQRWTADDEADASWDEPESPAAPAVIPARAGSRRGGAHRMPAPPTALKGRAAVVAVAAGAVVAAGQAAMASPQQPSQTIDYEAAGQIHEIAAQSMSLEDPTASPDSPQVLNVSSPANIGQFGDMLEKGRKYAEELAAAEAAKLRPLFAKFAAGNFTSGFGARWGVQHLGIDVAAPIGTPIYAVADGTVIEAGPASGFGMWVRLLHDDGTVTVYGHIDTATVSAGERVLAGDQIATVGNRGFSTGPHVHFEVWLNGSDKVDPVPWLATRGISLGPQRD